ncbi:hypothetical protein BHM03_00049818, partial [Ensete ventricosum]
GEKDRGDVAGTRTTRYQAVPPKIDRRRPIEGEIDRWRSIEGEKGKKKKRKRKKKRKEEYLFSYAILAGASLPVREPHAIGRFRQKSTVGGRLKGEIDCRRSIEGEIDRRRLIEREKGKKKKRKKKKKKRKEEKKNTYCPRAVLARAPSLLASCCRPRVASTLGASLDGFNYIFKISSLMQSKYEYAYCEVILRFAILSCIARYVRIESGDETPSQSHSTKVCNFDVYRPVRAVHTGPPGCRYANRPLPGSVAAHGPRPCTVAAREPKTRTARYIPVRQLIGTRISRYRVVALRSTVDSRFPSSMVDFRRLRSI